MCFYRFLLTNRIGRNGARTRLCFGRTDRRTPHHRSDALSAVSTLANFRLVHPCIAKLTTLTTATVVIWPQAAVSPRWRSILFRGNLTNRPRSKVNYGRRSRDVRKLSWWALFADQTRCNCSRGFCSLESWVGTWMDKHI